MRMLSLLAGAVMALGLTVAPRANAHGPDSRIWVSMGDVVFSAGRPYHRHHHRPLRVIHGHHGPRYYYVPTPTYGYYPAPRPLAFPAYAYPPAHFHPAPPPPRPGYHRHHRSGYYR